MKWGVPDSSGEPEEWSIDFQTLILTLWFIFVSHTFRYPSEVIAHKVRHYDRDGFWVPQHHSAPCQTSPPWPAHPGWPHTTQFSFIELDKLWSMWSDWLVVCDCGFSVSAFWCPLSAPTDSLGFLLPWTWGISSRLLQQSAATAPYLGCGVAPLQPHGL